MKLFLVLSILWPAVLSAAQSCRGSSSSCKTLVSCAPNFSFALDSCVLPNGKDVGVCCPTDSTAAGSKSAIERPTGVDGPAPDPPLDEVRTAAEQGLELVERLVQLERQLVAQGATKKSHHRPVIRSKPSANVRDRTLRGLRVIEASKQLQQRLNLNAEEMRRWMAVSSLKQTVLEDGCAVEMNCTLSAASKYRSADGSCNNLAHPIWGKQATTFQRILPPAYGNGIDSPRSAVDGSQLTNARQVSVDVVSIYGHNDPTNRTLAVMTWGQFITHDMALAADYTFEDGSSPMCCTRDFQMPGPDQMHPQCMSIDVGWDGIYNNIRHSVSCMAFTRSQVGADYGCTFGHAQQLNSNSHWLDASQVYGSDEATSDRLRMGQDGLMKTSGSQDRQLLPVGPGCSDHPFAVCFQAGDPRVEENPQLAIMHTLLLREHNRIAQSLKTINPHWTDEVLFQESRRIVVAEIQHVTYNEYLPTLLGSENVHRFGLLPLEGHSRNYNQTLNPSVTNEFTAAAFRIAHSSIQGYLELFNAADEEDTDKSFTLSNYFFDASRLQETGFIDAALRGLTKQPQQRIDTFYTNEVSMSLYREGKTWGHDLVAITVQRGRDHGVPSYNEYRQLCGLPRATSFDDLSSQMDDFAIDSFRRVYKSVDDIDLYIGCLAETPLGDSSVGPTAACIIGDQFFRVKNADRYFYDAANQAGSFTLEQLNQIRRSSLARLICDNNDGAVTHMQPLAMRSPYGTNERVPCATIPAMDFTPWKE